MYWSSWLPSPWNIRVSSTLSCSWIWYPSRSRKSMGSPKSRLQNCRRIVWFREYQYHLSSSCIPNLLSAPFIPSLLTIRSLANSGAWLERKCSWRESRHWQLMDVLVLPDNADLLSMKIYLFIVQRLLSRLHVLFPWRWIWPSSW